ncbi:sugar ABC transporter permease [Streptomyces sp. NPDC006368]|uniref:carbohydrate ABC transporter permease n=1 Tax=Streptomyces sp. NPDC006368 TaxID=3156760 RepID=UPI0033A389D1
MTTRMTPVRTSAVTDGTSAVTDGTSAVTDGSSAPTGGRRGGRPRHAPAHEVGRPGPAWAVPATVFFALFAMAPLVMVAVLSFTSWNGLGSPEFAGLDNWSGVFADPVMIKSIWLSLLLTTLGVAVQTPLSILLGVWAAGQQRNRAVLSAIYFIPLLLSSTAVSVLWRALLDPNFGVPSQAAWLFGDGDLFGGRATAIGVLAFVSTWQFTPFHTLIYQGAARAIPHVLYQAAEMDGAGRYRQFFHITLPQLRTPIVTSTILMVVGGLTTFETVLILTQGGPGTDTTITAFHMYQKAFKGFDFGAGSAIALVLVLAATIVSLVMVKLSGYDTMRGSTEGL